MKIDNLSKIRLALEKRGQKLNLPPVIHDTIIKLTIVDYRASGQTVSEAIVSGCDMMKNAANNNTNEQN